MILKTWRKKLGGEEWGCTAAVDKLIFGKQPCHSTRVPLYNNSHSCEKNQ